MKYSPLVNRIAGDGANAWLTHYEAWRARDRGEDVILLSVGDPDIDTPRPVVDKAVERLRAGDTHYTPAAGRESFRTAIAADHVRRYGQKVSAANVVVSSGAQNALFMASLCVAGPGDEIIALEPMYPTYPATIEVTGARLIRTASSVERGFRPDLDVIAGAITPRTRALFFATPNNPSGVILNQDELHGIAELARRHDLWIVADQVYAGLAPDGTVPTLTSILPNQLVTVCSLSKSLSMPGWRAGWMVAPADLAVHAEHVAMCMLFGLPGFIQDAGVTALQMAVPAEKDVRDYCARRRDLMFDGLSAIPGLTCHRPEAGMFMLVDVTGIGMTGGAFMRALYAEQKVSVLDGGVFGANTAGVVRICFATEETAIERACARIRNFVSSRSAATATRR